MAADLHALAERLLEGADRLAEIASLGEGPLTRSYAAGKWSGVQLLAHIADVDAVFFTRISKVLAEPGSRIDPFDENKWMEVLDGSARPLEVSVGLIVATREALAQLLRQLPREVWAAGWGERPDGRVTAMAMAEKVCNHGEHHLGQLEAIRDGRPWTKPA
jgi:uncharacterized damage-inducible protein DinB